MIESARRPPRSVERFVALFAIASFLFLARDSGPVVAAQAAAGRVVVPIERATVDLGAAVSRFTNAISEIDRLRAENARLRAEVDSLTLENVQLREEALAAESAAKLEQVASSLTYPTLGAAVIARDPSGLLRTITLDVGSDEGIVVGDVVLAEKGLVGRITQVFPSYSRVLPITDSGSAIAATVQRSRATGIVHGLFGDALSMEWILQDEQVGVGDVVITSGLALSNEIRSLFPKGLVIGTVAEVQRGDVGAYQKAVLLPAVDFSRLERVLVVKTN